MSIARLQAIARHHTHEAAGHRARAEAFNAPGDADLRRRELAHARWHELTAKELTELAAAFQTLTKSFR